MKIGWIGTGVMGRSMCLHLIKAGHEAYVYNRTKSKADDLIAAGATWCETPKEVASKADFIFSIVGFPKDVEETILGENGVLAGCSAGKTIIDMTTSKPSLAAKIHSEAAAMGVKALDAPVSGGDLGAQNGTLAIMVGGESDVFEKVLPLFEIMGSTIQLMGAPGAGQHTKMCNQILISGTMIGAVESLLYAQRSGLDKQSVINVIGTGAAGSWTINNLGPRIANKDFDPGFFIKHFVKDMGIALEEARRMNLSLPGLALVNQFYISAMAMGYENLGTQALYKVLENMNSEMPQ
ncbi:NAD(P)-dependent oxidoreductase [Maridesulfovibrio bastinii]|uniref:NAD(P)-dependent oxidoreductase n=1 Tax=Maridesulfovibrio bastinii TaxID=47157 RepID=UPI00042017B1|nr:NAD(P)-dependent oxidoreductase [Maridesulfovibrio bastinii]